MKVQYIIIAILFSIGPGILSAQPDEAYIKGLTGEIENAWLESVGKSMPVQQLDWDVKTVPGFKKTSDLSRQQALLSQSWNFFPIDLNKGISTGIDVKLPHSFEKERNYKSGWYFIKFSFEKKPNEKYILLLDRVEMFSMVFLNGTRCGHHFGAYTPFETDLSDELVSGENVLAIYVHDISATEDGDKLYNQIGNRGKTLKGGITTVPIVEIRDNSYIKDVFVKTSTRKSEMEIEYELIPESGLSADSKLSFGLFQWPDGEQVDLELPSVSFDPYSKSHNSVKIKWENPELWSPDHPNLYVLRTTFADGTSLDVTETRFGFREFWIEGKDFYLNGFPIRLRGDGRYNTYDHDIDIHRNEIRKQKEMFDVNTVRLHHDIFPKEVVDAADEIGILLDHQSAIWSASAAANRNGGEWFLKNTEIEFEEWVRRDRNSPAVVIWDLENEMLRVSFELHLPWVEQLPPYVLRFDNTRPLNHSGAGWFSPYQHMVWVHMQEHYTKIIDDWKKMGTKPLVIGEFWVGGRADFVRIPHSPELIKPNQTYVERAKTYEEQILGMRYAEVSGIIPFKVFDIFYPDSPREALEKMRHALQAVTVFVWPRQLYIESGKNLQREIVVCNDGETSEEFKVTWRWGNSSERSQMVFLQPYEQQRIRINENPLKEAGELVVAVKNDDKIISGETLRIYPIDIPEEITSKTIQVYNNPTFAEKLSEEGYAATSTISVPSDKDNVLWIIPEHADNRALYLLKDKILSYLDNGGAILCLKQDQTSKWFPVNLPFWSAYQSGIHTYALMGWEGLNTDLFYAIEAPNYASSHPVLKGISNMPLHLWDEFDGRISDHVYSRPSNVNRYEPGNWRPLVSGSRKHHVSLAEMFYGKGILFSCQLNVTDNLENAQAKTLFINMLNYLSERKPAALDTKIATAGTLESSEIEQLTGVETSVFKGASAKKHDLMIASEGASIEDVKKWASEGGKVLVFSSNVSRSFEGFRVEDSGVSQVAKPADTPLLYGVCSASFSTEVLSAFKGSFSQMPDGAKDVFRGLTEEGSYSPVMASLKYGNGEIIFSTLEIQGMEENIIREFLGLMLTNAGVQIPYRAVVTEEIAIKKTVPLKIDGELNDWTNDMEDRLVTKYIHAQPVFLSSESIVEGPPEFDLNLSAINYFMWNEEALNIAGVVFSEERTWESGVTWGSKKEYDMILRLNDDTIRILFEDEKALVWINNNTENSVAFEIGQVDSKELTDAVDFQFIYIFKSGQIRSESSLIGETFELSIPWNLLKSTPEQKEWKSFMTVEAKGSKLQVPISANPDSKDKWLKMILSK